MIDVGCPHCGATYTRGEHHACSGPPMPPDLVRITFMVATKGDRCDVTRCRASAKWLCATRYEGGKRHTTGLCEQHARNVAVGLGERL